MPVSTLYLCYFGLREPLVQTQVLPYLRELAAGGVVVNLLTFEPDLEARWPPAALAEARAGLEAEGVRWLCLPYHKRPSLPATAYDILAGARLAARLVRREGVQVLHARSHVPVAMAVLARALARCRVVFDVRGLLAEEYADAGVWRVGSLPYRAVKALERAGLRRADAVVVLTERMREWLARQGLAAGAKVEVIPCCVDLSLYAAAAGAGEEDEGGAGGRFEVVYAGSVTGLYLLEEMARFFLALRERRPGAFFRVLTASPPAEAVERLRRAGLAEGEFSVGAVAPRDVPRALRRARLGVSFRKATFSQIAASPTKVPEYLAAGLPVVSNAGVGDTDELLARERVGVVVRELTPEGLARAAAEALALADEPGVSARCMGAARRNFDLSTVGGRRYRSVYRRLEEQSAAPEALKAEG